MQIGIIIPQTEIAGDPAGNRAFALAAESAGLDHLLAFDHVLGATHDREPKLWGPYTEKHPFHDPFVLFGHLAAITSRIGFATGILILPQRQTALVARQAADVDLLSDERLRLGVGLGWNYVEYEALGQDFATRGRRMDEQVPLLRDLWAEEVVNFTGRFDRIPRAGIPPRPRRQIPIWMGGFADAALARASRLADGFIFADGPGEAFTKIIRMRELLAQQGRDASGFGLQANLLRVADPADVVDRIRQWQDLGGTHAAFSTMGHGLGGAQGHIDQMHRVADALTGAGLL